MQIPLLIASFILVSIYVNTKLPNPSISWPTKLKRIDWLGSLTLFTFIGSLIFAFSFKTSEDVEWSDPRVLGPLILSAFGAAAFCFVEVRVSPEPIMPVRLLLNRTPLAAVLTDL